MLLLVSSAAIARCCLLLSSLLMPLPAILCHRRRENYTKALEKLYELPPALAEVYRQRLCEDPAELAGAPAGRIVSFAMTPLGISATRIREALARRTSPRYLLPDAVLDYIQHHSLYQEI